MNPLRLKAKRAVDSSDASSSERLLDVLGFIPLAITQAAAFIKRNRCSLNEYLAAPEKSEQNLIDHLSNELQDCRRERGFSNSVFRTWKLSFDQIRKYEPITAKILSLMAMLDRQEIPKTLMYRIGERDVDVTTAIGTLEGFSLISKETENGKVVIHRLVQLSTRSSVCHD